jgi:transposase
MLMVGMANAKWLTEKRRPNTNKRGLSPITPKPVREFVRKYRSQLRIFFLPKRAPETNPDEQVWNEVKTNHVGKQPVKDKKNLKRRLRSVLGALQKDTQRILSFLQLPDTHYAAQPAPCES